MREVGGGDEDRVLKEVRLCGSYIGSPCGALFFFHAHCWNYMHPHLSQKLKARSPSPQMYCLVDVCGGVSIWTSCESYWSHAAP